MSSMPLPPSRRLSEGVRDKVYPGAVWAVGDAAGIHASGSTGVLDPDDPGTPMRSDTIFDAASLTKILAVWASIGALWEEGKLDLDIPLGTFWSEVDGHPLGVVTARQLLTHTAGVPLRAQLKDLYGTDPQDVRDGVLHEALHRPPGEAVEYTGRAALVLGYLAEHLAGQRLDELATQRTWQPLGMATTCFGPLPADTASRCAPTEIDPETDAHLKGIAHDFSARLLGGVCGIAGRLHRLGRPLRLPAIHARPHQRAWPGGVRSRLDRRIAGHPDRRAAAGTGTVLAPGARNYPHRRYLGPLRLHRHWHVDLAPPGQQCWSVLLTNKLFYIRDRQPLTDIRNAFRGLAFR